MAYDDGRGRCLCQTVAVILVLCCLAQSLTCFSLLGLSKNVKQDKMVSEAAVMEVRTGSILFNGKELDSKSGEDQSDDTGMLEQRSHVEDAMGDEAAWRRMNPSLHCGHKTMTLKVMGTNAPPLPLIQVPETCSYSVKQNALGLILIVPYDGCNVMQENGNYVLSMRWLETPVKLTCPMLTSSATPASINPKPAQQPWKFPVPHGPLSLTRNKRETKQPPSGYDPRILFHIWLYNYCMYLGRLAQAPGADTNAQPDVAISTPRPPTENYPQMNPAYPSAYHDYAYYPHYYLSNDPVQTTSPPATAKPTTGPATIGMTAATTTTAPATTTTAPATTTTAPATTTTAPVLTTKTGQKPQHPYFYFPYYSTGQFPGVPDNSDLYHYQIGQYYYGMPNVPMQTPQAPTVPTAEPVDPTTSAEPVDPTTTAKQSVSSTTIKPTTTSAPATTSATAQTTKAKSIPTKPSTNYPGPMRPYVPYHQLPFAPYVSLKNKADFPYGQNYMPQAGYKSRLQAQAPHPPHAGFQYWQPVS